MIEIKTVRNLVQAMRNHPHNFSSVGSYTLIYAHADGECSHPACVRERALCEGRKLLHRHGDRIAWLGSYDEGPALECALCGEPIESSYGDPELVTLETMPDCFRASHRAAGNWGVFPVNGAEREQVTREQAEEAIASDPDGYAHIVER